MSTDWSVASFIIFAQSIGTMPSIIVRYGKGVDGDALTSYLIKIIIGLIPSLYLYFKMNTDPTLWAAWGQVVMFTYASIRFFIDGRTAQKLTHQNEL
ncbi:hypothetical protein [Vibrio splendidus]|uniref:hypothetical protein n=1 Tax=Vibrio splendidus TaxID=29497 RepID=UPI0011B238BA|nr:hypothetical protein [Vibrio splendidus]